MLCGMVGVGEAQWPSKCSFVMVTYRIRIHHQQEGALAQEGWT